MTRSTRGPLAILFLLGAAWANLQAAPAKVVRVAVFPFMPGIFTNAEGNAQGFFVDMLGEVAHKEHWELRFVPGTWAEGLERVQRGEVDLLTSVAFTEERDRFLSYGRVPAFTVWSLLYANPKVPIQSVLDVQGRRVGVMRNDMNGMNFKQLVSGFGIPCEFVEYPGFPDVLNAVAEGRVEAGVTVNTFGYAKERDYSVTRTPVVFNPFNIYFAVAEGRNGAILAALDTYLDSGRKDPASGYHRALDRWLYARSVKELPPWVARTGISALVLLLISGAAVVFFRKKVASATTEIRSLNDELRQELSERRRKEELILNVASGVSAATGDSFFQDLVSYLGRATHSDIAFIGETSMHTGTLVIQTLAVFAAEGPGRNFSYPAKGTPCEQVLGGELCVIPDDVQERFPEDKPLRELKIRSYVGSPLISSKGSVLGHLAVLRRAPLEYQEEVSSLLRIFSSRAAAELERRQGESERLAFERKLQHTQKLESLGVLAGGIAHDFNNLLTAMLGHLNVAQAKLPGESPAQPHLETLERIVQRTSDLTRQMLAYSGKGRFVVKPHDLNRVVTEMIHLLEVSISKKISLRLSLASEVPPVKVDAAQIQQVIMNLVTNASDAIGDREGTIHIGTATRELDQDFLDRVFQNQALAPGAHVIVEVGDTGCGMSPEVQARIFDPFFTTKLTGRGLGLSATLGILRGHRAGFKIYSEQGRGSTFKLFFPACTEAALESSDGSSPTPILEGATILLVDDEALIRDSSKAMLEALGLKVLTAGDGQEAVEFFLRGGERVDLVLMDLTMPRMDGREAFEAIRRLHPTQPILLTSGYNEQDSVQDFLGRKLAGFIQKPYTMQVLREKLQEALNRA